MLEGNAVASLLIAAVALSTIGMACLALAMETHWEQVQGSTSPRCAVLRLRVLGICGLAAALALCLRVDHASMAALVWVMVLTASALAVAFALTWRPHWLRALAWMGRRRK